MRRTFAGIAVAVLALVPALSGQTVDYAKKPLQSERSRSYDALHYLIKLELDLDRKSFDGATTVTLSVVPGRPRGLRPRRRGVHRDLGRRRIRRRP